MFFFFLFVHIFFHLELVFSKRKIRSFSGLAVEYFGTVLAQRVHRVGRKPLGHRVRAGDVLGLSGSVFSLTISEPIFFEVRFAVYVALFEWFETFLFCKRLSSHPLVKIFFGGGVGDERWWFFEESSVLFLDVDGGVDETAMALDGVAGRGGDPLGNHDTAVAI